CDARRRSDRRGSPPGTGVRSRLAGQGAPFRGSRARQCHHRAGPQSHFPPSHAGWYDPGGSWGHQSAASTCRREAVSGHFSQRPGGEARHSADAALLLGPPNHHPGHRADVPSRTGLPAG
ncbi:Coq8b, partial [Symbiodinium sp. CCMP2456]